MKKIEPVNIIIPVYKDHLTLFEKSSLRQCISKLSSYPITLVGPKGLDMDVYFNEYIDFKVELFDPLYFNNTAGYSKLLMSQKFYSRFAHYEFILIYHLDAWVFRNDLAEWCSMDYDYVGAPWFEGWDKVEINARCLGVGNGGLSLRRVKKHLKYTSYPFLWIDRDKIFKNLHKGGCLDLLLLIPRIISRIYYSNLQIVRWNYQEHEDCFWSFVVGNNFKDFRIPDCKAAARFAFEYNPACLFKSIGSKLPFGCHKWDMNMDFWRNYIELAQFDTKASNGIVD